MSTGNEFKVIIGGDNKPLKNVLNDSKNSLNKFSGLAVGLGAGFGVGIFAAASSAISGFVSGSIQEFEEAERSIESLRQTLEAVGRMDVFDRIIRNSKELQKEFKYLDNDDVQNAFQRLIQFGGLTENQMSKLIPVIVDLNAKQRLAGQTNKSVADTAEQVVKALAGSSRELKQYGVEVKSSNSQTENLNILLDTLGEKVRGAADAFGNSLEGKLASNTQRMKEMQEELGGKLLPLKFSLLSFATDAASAFETLYQKLTGTFEATQKARKELELITSSRKKAKEFAENAGEFLSKATESDANAYIDFFEKKIDTLSGILAKKLESTPGATSDDFPAISGAIQSNRDLVDALREKLRLIRDTSTIGKQTTTDEEKKTKKATDALKDQIKALSELGRVSELTGGQKIKLANLKVELFERDTAPLLTADEAQQATDALQDDIDKIFFKREFLVPITFKPYVVSIDTDASADNLQAGLDRMQKRIEDAGIKAGESLRDQLNSPLMELQASFSSILSNTLQGFGDAIGEVFAGANPAKAFLTVIAGAISELGRALIQYGIATLAAKRALELGPINPFIAIGAGVAAIAAGSLLRSRINQVPRLAEGGIADRPTIAMVGEAGKEAIIPLNKLSSLLGSRDQSPMTGEFILRGGDLILAYNRAVESKGRRGG